jgi:hypothetical protein
MKQKNIVALEGRRSMIWDAHRGHVSNCYGPNNHRTLATELAQSGVWRRGIMSISGHVSRAVLFRYSHVIEPKGRHSTVSPRYYELAQAADQGAA